MLSRRQFVSRASFATAATVVSPQTIINGWTTTAKAQLYRGGLFSDGVASGDPTPTTITLWTRLHDVSGTGSVKIEVAKDKDFKRLVAKKRAATSSSIGRHIKVLVEGLEPYEQYYYRFSTRDTDSPVGRFKTALPADSNQPVKFAYYSCQDFEFGYYNAHNFLADEDIDFVLCLGDYIYGDVNYGGVNHAHSVRKDNIGDARKLAEYRAKYSLYRSDRLLRKMHANHATITVWDDHEVKDNYSNDPTSEDYNAKMIAAGYQAFFENQPTFAVDGNRRLYRNFKFGKNLDLIMIDDRQYRSNQPCNDGITAPCEDFFAPRKYLGPEQQQFVQQTLLNSTASWKVIGNQAPVMPAKLGKTTYRNFDAWQGYPAERQELLNFISSNSIKDVVFATGDVHYFAAGEVMRDKTGGANLDPQASGLSNSDFETVAAEFIGGSISSAGISEVQFSFGDDMFYQPNDLDPSLPSWLTLALQVLNPWIKDFDLTRHGYVMMEANDQHLDVKYRRVSSVKKKLKHTEMTLDRKYRVERGSPEILVRS